MDVRRREEKSFLPRSLIRSCAVSFIMSHEVVGDEVRVWKEYGWRMSQERRVARISNEQCETMIGELDAAHCRL